MPFLLRRCLWPSPLCCDMSATSCTGCIACNCAHSACSLHGLSVASRGVGTLFYHLSLRLAAPWLRPRPPAARFPAICGRAQRSGLAAWRFTAATGFLPLAAPSSAVGSLFQSQSRFASVVAWVSMMALAARRQTSPGQQDFECSACRRRLPCLDFVASHLRALREGRRPLVNCLTCHVGVGPCRRRGDRLWLGAEVAR